jgi:hypothetical protein
MTATERAEMKLLRESLERADHLASAQVKTIAALETALAECQKGRDALQQLAADQQRRIVALEGVA